jgi:hypothetical protein
LAEGVGPGEERTSLLAFVSVWQPSAASLKSYLLHVMIVRNFDFVKHFAFVKHLTLFTRLILIWVNIWFKMLVKSLI